MMPRLIKPLEINPNNVNKEKAFVVLKYDGKYENDEDKIDYQEMKRTILESINDFCNEQLYCERYDISLGRPYYDIKKITIKRSLVSDCGLASKS